jgi:hypothetical protein
MAGNVVQQRFTIPLNGKEFGSGPQNQLLSLLEIGGLGTGHVDFKLGLLYLRPQ